MAISEDRILLNKIWYSLNKTIELSRHKTVIHIHYTYNCLKLKIQHLLVFTVNKKSNKSVTNSAKYTHVQMIYRNHSCSDIPFGNSMNLIDSCGDC